MLEGVCFALRDSLSILQELGAVAEQSAAHRRRARGVPFCGSLQAEVFGVPVSTVNREEGPAYGAALLAAVGAGAFPDLARPRPRDAARAPAVGTEPPRRIARTTRRTRDSGESYRA